MFPLVAQSFMRDVEKLAKAGGSKEVLSDEALSGLHTIFGCVLERAMTILDKPSCLVVLKAPTGRSVFQISGTAIGLYSLFPGINYCPCPAFQYHVVKEAREVTCKHVLAAWLGFLLGKHKTLQISEQSMFKLLLSMAVS